MRALRIVRTLVATLLAPRAIWQSVLVVTVALAYMWHFVNVSVDDVFISFRYADNLAQGRGLVFNEGERVEGFSNFLWTVLLSVASFCGASQFQFGLLVVAKLFGAICATATLYVLFDLGQQVSGRRGAWLGPALVATSAPFVFWSIAGLETPLLIFCECLALNLHFREQNGRRLCVPSSLFWLLAALTRPEPVVLFGVCVLDRWIEQVRARRWNLGNETVFLSWFVLPYLGLLGLRLGYYGEWVPNTYYAKMHMSPRVWIKGWLYVKYGINVLGWAYCVPIMMTGLFLGGRFGKRVRLVLALTVVRLVIVMREGGDWMPALRFLTPVVPMFGILAHAALVGWLGVAARRLAPQSSWPGWVIDPSWVAVWRRRIEGPEVRRVLRPVRWLGASILVGALTLANVRGVRSVNLAWFPSGYGGVWLDPYSHFELARIMRDELKLTGTVATGEAGVIPYYSGLRLLDLNALMDKHLARQPGAMHLKHDLDYVFARRPDSIVLLGKRNDSGRVVSTTDYATRIGNDPRTNEHYELVREHEDQLLLYVRREGH